jgi:hypothetical protein
MMIQRMVIIPPCAGTPCGLFPARGRLNGQEPLSIYPEVRDGMMEPSGERSKGGAMLALSGKGIVIAVVAAAVVLLAMGGYAIYFLFIKKD